MHNYIGFIGDCCRQQARRNHGGHGGHVPRAKDLAEDASAAVPPTNTYILAENGLIKDFILIIFYINGLLAIVGCIFIGTVWSLVN